MQCIKKEVLKYFQEIGEVRRCSEKINEYIKNKENIKRLSGSILFITLDFAISMNKVPF